MTNSQKNIVYILGAGASANSIPVLKTFTSDMYETLRNSVFDINDLVQPYIYEGGQSIPVMNDRVLEEYKEDFLNDVEWFINETNKYDTVDQFAIILSRVLGDKVALKKLKALMSLYLIQKQIHQENDKRYNAFFSHILQNENGRVIIPERIKIISWNYDLQCEKSLNNLLKKSSLNDIHSEFSIWPNCFHSFKLEKSPQLIKMNGTAGLYHNIQKNNLEILDNVISADEDTSTLDMLKRYRQLRDDNGYESLIYFANEDIEITNRSQTEAQDFIRKADRIVIIGYSFPEFNRTKDVQIFDGLKKNGNRYNVKIFIQDPNAHKLVNILKSKIQVIKDLSSGTTSYAPIKLIPEEDCNKFLTPEEVE